VDRVTALLVMGFLLFLSGRGWNDLTWLRSYGGESFLIRRSMVEASGFDRAGPFGGWWRLSGAVPSGHAAGAVVFYS